jgi:cell division protein FtsL
MKDSPLVKLLAWMFQWQQLQVVALVFLVAVSSVGVIYSVYVTRLQYSKLQDLEKEQDLLDSDFERLLLEQGAWAGYARVDEVSRVELGMKAPAAADLVFVDRRSALTVHQREQVER